MAFWEVLGPRGGGAQWVMGYQIKGMDSLYLPDTFPAILDFALIFKLWSVHIYIIAKMPMEQGFEDIVHFDPV